MVKFLRLAHWRRTLGWPTSADELVILPSDATLQARARAKASSMDRADWRLPLPTKCLARAVALQWRLRLAGIPSLLVIAFHRTDRKGDHAYHAWVEREGEMLIGRCDRSEYRRIMVYAQGIPASTSGAASAR